MVSGSIAVLAAALVAAPAPAAAHRGPEAFFALRSYAPGSTATLEVSAPRGRVAVQIFRVGPEARAVQRSDVMAGVPVNDPRTLRWRGRAGFRSLWIAVRYWPSGLYFARVSSSSSGTCFAPFVVRAGGIHARVAVVLPTNTWQAYNKRDDDGNGTARQLVRRSRGHERPARAPVPRSRRAAALPAVRPRLPALARAHRQAGGLLRRRRPGAHLQRPRLAQAYDLVVFAGHEEYVTAHEYDLTTAYRDAGGNLMFLSANNFFYKVTRRGGRLYREQLWRDLGRPGGGARRRPVPRLVPEPLRERAYLVLERRRSAVAVRRHRAARRLALRHVRHRDRPPHRRVAAVDPGAGPACGHLRRRRDRRDDVLHDDGGREGLRRRVDQLRRLGGGAARADAAREPLEGGSAAPDAQPDVVVVVDVVVVSVVVGVGRGRRGRGGRRTAMSSCGVDAV